MIYTNKMLCPNCGEQLSKVHYSNQEINHCTNCGGSFFGENSINRITPDDATKLADDSKSHIVKGGPKICPKDNIFLQLIENDEAIPHNVSLYKCPKCHGVFANSDDLKKFKKAQDIKIEFFKIWDNPLPSLKAVLVLSLIAVLSLSVISNLNNKAVQSTQAEDLVKNVLFIETGDKLLVNFRTTKPYISKVLIEDKTTGQRSTQDITTSPSTFHTVTISNLTLSNELYYQIILQDETGKEYKGDKKLVTF